MKNNVLSNETEWRGTGMLSISIEPKGKGETFFLSNEETKVNYKKRHNSAICCMQ